MEDTEVYYRDVYSPLLEEKTRLKTFRGKEGTAKTDWLSERAYLIKKNKEAIEKAEQVLHDIQVKFYDDVAAMNPRVNMTEYVSSAGKTWTSQLGFIPDPSEALEKVSKNN